MRYIKRKYQIILLSITLVGMLPALVSSDSLMLNFRDVDIRQIIESVGELTGKNFIIDPRVRGKVTIFANEEVPEDALYDMLLSILRMHGFRAIEGANLTRVVPANLGARYPKSTVGEDLVTEIISIHYLNVASVMPIIKPLLTPQAQTIAHKDTNKIIVTEVRANLHRIKQILKRIDIQDVSDFEIIDLKYSSAKELYKVLVKIQGKQLKHLVEIIADEESGRIILSGPSDMRLRLRTIIAELDIPVASSHSGGLIQVIPLHYAKASDMVQIIKNLFSSADFLKTLDAKGTYEFSEIKTTSADKAKNIIESKIKKAIKKSSANNSRNYTIQADAATNSLVVGGPQRILDAVRHVIRKLDVPRPQVLIEAIIADISANQTARINSAITSGRNLNGATIDANTYRGLIGSLSDGRIALTGQLVSGIGSASAYSLSFMIDALRTDGNTNVLSTPSILTMNNEQASINVAENRYVQTGTTTGSGGTTASIKKENFGTQLIVTPQITEGDAVRLDIEQETEDIVASDTEIEGNFYPRSIKRILKTSVLVNDGDILVLGGLITDNRTETQQRVPWLSKIPILGHLFKDRESTNNTRTLMIFIRPTILRTPAASHEFSKERYAKLRLEQLLYGDRIDSFLPDEDIKGKAVLPKIKNKKSNKKSNKKDMDKIKKSEKK